MQTMRHGCKKPVNFGDKLNVTKVCFKNAAQKFFGGRAGL
jgi:hypothetical protein